MVPHFITEKGKILAISEIEQDYVQMCKNDQDLFLEVLSDCELNYADIMSKNTSYSTPYVLVKTKKRGWDIIHLDRDVNKAVLNQINFKLSLIPPTAGYSNSDNIQIYIMLRSMFISSVPDVSPEVQGNSE